MSKDSSIESLNNGGSVSFGGLSRFSIVVALIWLIGFSLWFQSFGFANNSGVYRWMFWINLPYDLLDLVDPPSEAGKAAWSWFFLLERVPFLLVALATWTGGWGIGSLILRGIRAELRGAESFFFSLCLGLSATSLTMLFLGLCGCLSRWPLIAIFVLACLLEIVARWKGTSGHQGSEQANDADPFRASFPRLGWIIVIGLLPFVFGQMIGAMTPQNDFDVIEYHLGGPKEWFQMGRIQRLPHNVYTSFPFLSEMLILSGMVLYGDWNWGALAGQATIAGFAPLTAIGLYAAGKRWFSHWTGLLAALVYLTSPWTYRFTIIAYAEGGLSCYLFATIFAVLRFADQPTEDPSKTWSKQNVFCFLAGLLAGCAMACKYTGLALVVIPAGLILLWAEWRRVTTGKFQKIVLVAMIYSFGVFLSIGPWLIKNAVETGNPVYPLAVRIFGGVDRDPDIDAKFRHGHAATSFESWGKRLQNLAVSLADVSANNDWHSPLLFGLAPLTLLLFLKLRTQSSAERLSRPVVIGILWLYVGCQFFIWWVLTHHIDRFYVPMFSSVALLAGIGARWLDFDSVSVSRNWRSACWSLCSGIVIVGSALYGANLMQHGICGFSAGRMKLQEAREIAISTSVPRLKWYHEEILAGHFTPKMKVLFAGEAGLFHAQFSYVYNTVFDHELLEQICVQSKSTEHQLRPTEEILAEFRRRGITHIDVCWAEVLRYRAPGSYGYNNFVNPETFAELQRRGILGPPLKLPEQVSRNALSDSRKQLIEELHWDRSLITTVNHEPAYISAQVFPVLRLASDRLPGE